MIELEFSYPKKKSFKTYLSVDLNTEEIFVDLMHGLPISCFLCASCDGALCFSAPVGSKGKKQGFFVSIEWLINEWGGQPDLVKAIANRKEKTLKDIPSLREKYKDHKEYWGKNGQEDQEAASTNKDSGER